MRLATAEDDALLRRLMRENGMPSWVEMVLQREPSYFAGHGAHDLEWAVVAEDGPGPVGMYSAALSDVYIDGAPVEAGYLGGLRVEAQERHRIRHLRAGYASIQRLAPRQPRLSWWYTVIARENEAARRLLEARVRGLPNYRRLGDMETFAVQRRGAAGRDWQPATEQDIPDMLSLHATCAARFQLAPVLSAGRLHRIGLASCRVVRRGKTLSGMAVLWDQRAFRQIVARHYRQPLHALRPLYNAYAKASGRPRLPAVGQALPQCFIAFLALAPSEVADADRAAHLLRDLVAQSPAPVASLGLHAGHPLVPVMESLRPLRYGTCVYAVEFDGPAVLDGRPVQPEVALL